MISLYILLHDIAIICTFIKIDHAPIHLRQLSCPIGQFLEGKDSTITILEWKVSVVHITL